MGGAVARVTPADGWLPAAAGARLHYLDWGDRAAAPVVFLHGASAHAHWWDFTLPALAARYRCVALDLRGHGASGRPADGDYRLATHAGDVHALCAALGLRRPALVGHSFGGFVALHAAARPDASFAALALIDNRVAIGARSARLLEALRKLPPARWPSRAAALARFRLMPGATVAPPERLAHVAAHAVAADDAGTWALAFDRRALAGAVAQDLAPQLRAARCPVLAVRGALSTVVDAAALAAYRQARADVELAEIAGAHHHVMLDQPAALAATLDAFLARHLRAA